MIIMRNTSSYYSTEYLNTLQKELLKQAETGLLVLPDDVEILYISERDSFINGINIRNATPEVKVVPLSNDSGFQE